MYKKYIYIIYSCCKTSVLKVVFDEKKKKKKIRCTFFFSYAPDVSPIKTSSEVSLMSFVTTLPVG